MEVEATPYRGELDASWMRHEMAEGKTVYRHEVVEVAAPAAELDGVEVGRRQEGEGEGAGERREGTEGGEGREASPREGEQGAIR